MNWCRSEEVSAKNLVYANGDAWWTLAAWVTGKKEKIVTIKLITPVPDKHGTPGMSKDEWREMANAILSIYSAGGSVVHIDGCLGASGRKIPIPCEEVPWDKALDVIVGYLKENVT